ncbi:hotdog family protein [Alteromonadaceae bacterium BrNp21-10]|nr:hotdog family protein [Alteromonadaceae bacterium BrNp21-10]
MYKIEQVLPHAAPMILVDELCAYDQNSAVCKVTITTASAFFDETANGVPSYVGIEYMAQTIAAFAGAHEQDAGHLVQIGFLLGSRKYNSLTSHFGLGSTLHISVTRLYQEDSGLSVFDCKIKHQASLLASAKVNTFQPENANQYLREQNQ